jgi:integrase
MHPALENALLEWRAQSLYATDADFVFPSVRNKGRKPLDLSAVLKRMIQPAFAKLGITGVGWHTFRHSVGSTLADMGEHQLTIRDYLRHSNLTSPTNICRRHRTSSVSPRGSSSMRSFRADRCLQAKQVRFSKFSKTDRG